MQFSDLYVYFIATICLCFIKEVMYHSGLVTSMFTVLFAGGYSMCSFLQSHFVNRVLCQSGEIATRMIRRTVKPVVRK